MKTKKKELRRYYKYCQYCGKKTIEKPRDHTFNIFTGKPLTWLLCPEYKEGKVLKDPGENHSKWLKELAYDQY